MTCLDYLSLRFLRICVRVTATLCLVSILSFAQKVDRSKPPTLGPAPTLHLPTIQHLTLSNGLRVILLEKHNLPLCQVELVVRAGSFADLPGKSGLADMTSAMMEQGAGSRTALEFADAIDFLGASISAFSGWHTSGVSLHTTVSKLDSSLMLLADMALHPSFPTAELDRLRKDYLTTLIQWHDDPQSIASVAFNKILYGEVHPYGIPSIGNEKTIRAFTVEDLKAFHSVYFHPNNTALIVVGDVTGQQLLSKLEPLFGNWKAGEAPKFTPPEAVQSNERKVYLVDKPGAAQSVICVGKIAVDRMTPDYYALQVMNTILGGSFTSRLNQNLRERHGYAYGASSGFEFRKLPGPFSAVAAVQTNKTDSALAEFMKELNGILSPVSDEELTRAKNYLTLRYPGNFESVSRIANRLVDLVVYDLPDDYFNAYAKNILSVTKEDVERVARKYLEPGKLDIVIVGDKKEIEKGIADLKIAPIQPLTVDEVLGPAPVLSDGH